MSRNAPSEAAVTVSDGSAPDLAALRTEIRRRHVDPWAGHDVLLVCARFSLALVTVRRRACQDTRKALPVCLRVTTQD